MGQQNSFFNVCGCCEEMGALGLFAFWVLSSTKKRYQMSFSAQSGCVGVVNRFRGPVK